MAVETVLDAADSGGRVSLRLGRGGRCTDKLFFRSRHLDPLGGKLPGERVKGCVVDNETAAAGMLGCSFSLVSSAVILVAAVLGCGSCCSATSTCSSLFSSFKRFITASTTFSNHILDVGLFVLHLANCVVLRLRFHFSALTAVHIVQR